MFRWMSFSERCYSLERQPRQKFDVVRQFSRVEWLSYELDPYLPIIQPSFGTHLGLSLLYFVGLPRIEVTPWCWSTPIRPKPKQPRYWSCFGWEERGNWIYSWLVFLISPRLKFSGFRYFSYFWRTSSVSAWRTSLASSSIAFLAIS